MEFVSRFLGPQPERIGILAGSFNPPTVAHLELIYAGGFHVDEVVCVLPRAFPHKEYFGATLEQRLDMLRACEPPLPSSIAVSDNGLLVDIAKECREHYGATSELYFLCGADAAERIINWDYGKPDMAKEMLTDFQLLVAPRGGIYAPPDHLKDRIHSLWLRGNHELVSSTEVRQRIQAGKPWEHLVPEEIRDSVRSIYS